MNFFITRVEEFLIHGTWLTNSSMSTIDKSIDPISWSIDSITINLKPLCSKSLSILVQIISSLFVDIN